jgi:hypothetical protein
MMKRMFYWAFVATTLLLLCCLSFGCDSSTSLGPEDGYRERLAAVMNVTVPDTVSVGSTFEVVMLSSAANGCWKIGRDELSSTSPVQATITPYDQENVESDVCPQNAPTFRHLVSLSAAVPGDFSVTVRTRMKASTGKDSVGTIQRTVAVR